jgi:hypothetical protein
MRILFLGGSTTAGFGSGPATTFPLLFKGMLKTFDSSPDVKEFDIVNAGQNGNSTYGYLYQYDKTDAFAGVRWDKPGVTVTSHDPYSLKTPTDNARFTIKDLEADIVIIAPGFNDQHYFNSDSVLLDPFQDENKVSINKTLELFQKNFIFKYNAIGHYIYTNAYGYLYNKALRETTSYAKIEKLSLYKNRLRLLIKKILNDSKKIIFLLVSTQHKEKEIYHSYYLNDKIVFNEIAEEFNLPVYDLNENNLNQNRKGYWRDPIHPTAIGYNDYAVKLFNLIISEKSSNWRIVRKSQ